MDTGDKDKEEPQEPHVHHWIIANTPGPVKSGFCKICYDTRDFPVVTTQMPQRLTCPRCNVGILRPKTDAVGQSYYKCDRCKATFE